MKLVLLSSGLSLITGTLLTYKHARMLVDVLDRECVYTRVPMIHVPFDCEHVVPRSFIRDKTVECDLHVLFKCTPSVNRSRGRKRFDVTTTVATFGIHDATAKGVVARACLYYRQRYCHDTDALSRFDTHVIHADLLDEWYELHGRELSEDDVLRNWVVHRAQGVCNPFVGRPDVRHFFLSSHGQTNGDTVR